jgi:hypothetical protein
MAKRVKRKVPVQQCAEQAGVSVAHYYAVLSGSGCSLDTAQKIARIEKVNFLHLMRPKEYDTKGRKIKNQGAGDAAGADEGGSSEGLESEGGV